MKKFIFLFAALLVFSISSAQTQRTSDAKTVGKTTTVKAADGSTIQQTTTTTISDEIGNDAQRQNTSDILTPVGAKVNATDGQTAPAGSTPADPAVKTTTTTTTTKTAAPRP